MKEHMKNYVDRERHVMFHAATRSVEQHLNQMCKALQNSMETRADEIFVKMNTDYMNVLGGMAHPHSSMLQSPAEKVLRLEIREVLRGIDAQFEPIANGELEALETGTSDTQMDDVPFEEDDSGVFESAQEAVNSDANDDSIMDGADDISFTEPTPSRHGEPSFYKSKANEGEKSGLRLSSSEGTTEEEL